MKTSEFATDNNVGRNVCENVPETNVGKINGRTPDQTKKGLECCINYQSCTEYGEPQCPYNGVTKCM